MDQPLCKLTLVYPKDIADSVVELILSMKPAIGGFTTLDVEGHGFDFSRASLGERVRGRVERQMLVSVLPREHAAAIRGVLRERLPVPHLTYWLEPVLEFGQLIEHPNAAERASL